MATRKPTKRTPARATRSAAHSRTRKPAVRAAKPVSRQTARKTAARRTVRAASARATPPARRRGARRRDPNRYDPAAVEPKWQRRWEQSGLYRVDLNDTSKPKFYFLTMYPYPSGDLHIGHWYAMSPSDAAARYRRMKGYNVFFPMGFDAFGLPAENAAIKRGVHPYKWTIKNIERMRKQLRTMGTMFDWEKEVVTCDPNYYRWNQWFFLQFFKRGLAYKKMAPVDWCPKDQTVLAREQVVGDKRVCERCGTPVIKRDLEQWFFRITAYADELLDFSRMEWPERVRTMQTNWIGHAPGYAVRSDVHRAGAGASAGREVDNAGIQARRRCLRGGGAPHGGHRSRSGRQGEDRAVHRRVRRPPAVRHTGADLHRRLRADHLRHRRDHGRAGTRRARLGVRQEV
jgi:hypothetical protein